MKHKNRAKQKRVIPCWADPSETPEDRGMAAWEDFEKLAREYQTFEQDRQIWYELYKDCILDFLPFSRSRSTSFYTKVRRGMTRRVQSKENVLNSVIMAQKAGITNFKPRPKFNTEGANGLIENAAERMQAFVDTLFRRERYYNKSAQAYEDCATDLFGCMQLKVNADKIESGDPLTIEYVSSQRVLIPNWSRYTFGQKLPEVYLVHEVPLSELRALYPEPVEKYLRETQGVEPDEELSDELDTYVTFVERWCIPSAIFPGRYSVFWEHGELESDGWDFDFIPFTFCVYAASSNCFFGTPLVSQLVPLQLKINDCNRAMTTVLIQSAIQKYFVPQEAKIIDDEINNIFNTIVHGSAPPSVIPSVASNALADYRAEKKDAREQMFQLSGVSEANATGQKPAGLNSGEAQRQYQDQVNRRFALVEEIYTDMAIDMAHMAIKIMSSLYKSNKKLKASAIDRNLLASQVSWSEIDLDESAYVIVTDKAAILPSETAGRVQLANEMIQQGGWEPEEAYELVEFHNPNGMVATKNIMRKAIKSWIQRRLDKLLKTNTTLPAAFDPNMALKLIDERILFALCAGQSELDTDMRMLADMRDEAEAAIQAMKPAQAPPQPATGAEGLPIDPGAPMAPAGPSAPPMNVDNLTAAPMAAQV